MTKSLVLGAVLLLSIPAMASYTCSAQCYHSNTTVFIGQLNARQHYSAAMAMNELLFECGGQDKVLVHKISFEQPGDFSTRRISSLEVASPVNSCVKDVDL